MADPIEIPPPLNVILSEEPLVPPPAPIRNTITPKTTQLISSGVFAFELDPETGQATGFQA